MITLRRTIDGLVLVLLGLVANIALAASSNFNGGFVANCTLASETYTCSALPLSGSNDTITIASGYTVDVASPIDFGSKQGLTMSGTAVLSSSGSINLSNISANLKVSGGSLISGANFTLGAKQSITATVSAAGTVWMNQESKVEGTVSGATVIMGSQAQVIGNVKADQLTMESKQGRIQGDATVKHATLGFHALVEGDIYCVGSSSNTCSCVTDNTTFKPKSKDAPSCKAAPASLHHILITHAGTALTCTPQTVTLTACENASCSTPHYSGTTNVTLSPGGASFAIGTSGINSAATVAQGTAGTASLSASSSVATTSGFTCLNSSSGANSCSMLFSDSGFLVDAPDHYAAASGVNMTISAVRKADNAPACTPAFASVTKSVNLQCSYVNPASGTKPLLVGEAGGGTAALSCDGSGHAVNLNFNASGVASTSLLYADVGRMTVGASLAVPAMSGSDTFIAAPSALVLSGTTPAAPIKAGTLFTSIITASNRLGDITPNFGAESPFQAPQIILTKCQPTLGASGTFGSSAAFDNGAVLASMSWSEVGVADLTATLAGASYLDSGLNASGNTGTDGTLCKGGGNVGRFIPDHFDVAVNAPAVFTYSGQPITITTVTARSASGSATVNYNHDTGFAKKVTLSAWNSAATATNPGPGALGAATIESSAFSSVTGAASAAPIYTFSSKLTAPATIRLRATDIDGVSSATGLEPAILIRSGRLRIASAYGNPQADLALPVRAEYWTGSSWLQNSDDSLTSVPADAVALSGRTTGLVGGAVLGSVTLSAGKATLMLGKPSSGTGSIDLALNLGNTTIDQSCLPMHPASVGAALNWLRSFNGMCSSLHDRDPSARASFGVYAPETRKMIHVREVFN